MRTRLRSVESDRRSGLQLLHPTAAFDVDRWRISRLRTNRRTAGCCWSRRSDGAKPRPNCARQTGFCPCLFGCFGIIHTTSLGRGLPDCLRRVALAAEGEAEQHHADAEAKMQRVVCAVDGQEVRATALGYEQSMQP